MNDDQVKKELDRIMANDKKVREQIMLLVEIGASPREAVRFVVRYRAQGGLL